MKKLYILIFLSIFATTIPFVNAQETAATDTSKHTNVRTGWTLGVLPSVAFDADLGFQYGALTNIYYFGNGDIYPEYYHSIYAEAAYTTNNYGLFRLSYDSKYLIPKHRLSVDLSYLPDAMCDFLGFNGYQSVIHSEWASNSTDNTQYISRAFYRMQRDIFRLSADLQGTLNGNWYWNGGIGVLNYNVGEVNIDRLNRNKKDENDKLPDTTSLYSLYVNNGIIAHDEASGGIHPYIHGGITYDTRDRQQNPKRGIHADAFLSYSAAFGEQSEYNNIKLNAAWRHYVPIIHNRLTFAYRAGTQLLLAGKSPFYANSYINQLYMQRVLYEGLGGANSLRGIMRNRILANGFAYGNVELRIQLAQFRIGKENFYIGINPFMDGGVILQPMEIPESLSNNDGLLTQSIGSTQDLYKPHISAGCGLKIAMNDNFILSVDWATALNNQDNYKPSNLYIKMGYMF